LSAPRAVIVTGGTGALGQAVVKRLLAAGARVAVPFRRESEWSALRAAHTSSLLWGHRADIAEPREAQAFLEAALGFLGSLDGLACVAGGYAGGGTLETAPHDEWDRMLQVNLATTHGACRAALPRLLEARGAIVTVSARAVASGGGGAAAYAVSKAAVEALTRAIAAENRDRGVRANCVAPGTLDTPANRAAMPEADFSKWTRPDAVAEVVLFLLSADSAPLTGAVLPVDLPA
jgi:NAD(P)-dependent dehydrogenase (short-subunit alcohol dehydrogenase family)